MDKSAFVKGTAVGAVAVLLFGSGAAVAGSGIGGVFNLGQANSVNARTTLTGAPAGPSLSIINTSPAAGATTLSLSPAAGRPAITAGNKVLNPNLNAQFLGGYAANSLNRIGISASEGLTGQAASDTQATVTITAPAKGFAVVEGSVIMYDGFSSALCIACYGFVRVRDEVAGTDSPMSLVSLSGDGTNSTSQTVAVRWVFPVTAAGSRSYSLTTAQNASSGSGPAGFYNPVLTAQFVPFGATGSPSTLGTASVRRGGGAKDVTDVLAGRDR